MQGDAFGEGAVRCVRFDLRRFACRYGNQPQSSFLGESLRGLNDEVLQEVVEGGREGYWFGPILQVSEHRYHNEPQALMTVGAVSSYLWCRDTRGQASG